MRIATAASAVISVLALGVSGFGLFDGTLRAPRLTAFVAPRLDYTDPDRPEDVREVFILPITIANDGARSGTVLAMSLKVVNPRSNAEKTFYGARLGTWGEKPLRPFAPLVLFGRTTFTQAVQFEPRAGEPVPRILDLEPGTYRLSLALESADTAPVTVDFEVQAGGMDYRMFQGTGTMELWLPTYKAAVSK